MAAIKINGSYTINRLVRKIIRGLIDIEILWRAFSRDLRLL